MIYIGLLDEHQQELYDANYRRVGFLPEMWTKLLWLGEPALANNEPMRFSGRYGLVGDAGEARYVALYRNANDPFPYHVAELAKPILLRRATVLLIHTRDLKISLATLAYGQDPLPRPERFFAPLAKPINLGFNTDELVAPDCWL